MKAFDYGVPILPFDDNEVLVQTLLVRDRNIYLTRSARPALQDSVVLDADFASFVQRRNQLFEACPIHDQFGNLHHIEAVEAYGEALKERTREHVPLQWAATQNNLGEALTKLGERESGSRETLQKAVEAYREALKVFTKEAAPY
jgi:hypothetical protein